MGGVLPGEADAAVHGDIALGTEAECLGAGEEGVLGVERDRRTAALQSAAGLLNKTAADSAATHMSARRCLIAWKLPMGRLNW